MNYFGKLNTNEQIVTTDNEKIGYIKMSGERPTPEHIANNKGEWILPIASLEELKAKKWEEIKQARDSAEQGGCTYKDTEIDSDIISVSRINVACIAAQNAILLNKEFSISWTMKDNVARILSAVEVLEMSTALAIWSNTCHEKGRVLREKIKSATTAEELENIVW